MNYGSLVQLYFERSNALQWYWTLYVVIIGGLLAFSSLRQRRDFLTLTLVSVLFVLFAYKNAGAIVETSQQRAAALASMRQLHPTEATAAVDALVASHLEPTLNPTPADSARNFHYLCDALTLATLWAMELRRIRAARDARLAAA